MSTFIPLAKREVESAVIKGIIRLCDSIESGNKEFVSMNVETDSEFVTYTIVVKRGSHEEV